MVSGQLERAAPTHTTHHPCTLLHPACSNCCPEPEVGQVKLSRDQGLLAYSMAIDPGGEQSLGCVVHLEKGGPGAELRCVCVCGGGSMEGRLVDR